jgi:hypothetical protein
MKLNKRMISTAVALLATGAIAGCGSTTQTNAPKAAPVATQTQTPQQAGAGYYNMDTLAGDIKSQVQAKLDKQGAGEQITNVTCILTGPQTAECNGTFSDGDTESVTVSISADGNQYISAGSS